MPEMLSDANRLSVRLYTCTMAVPCLFDDIRHVPTVVFCDDGRGPRMAVQSESLSEKAASRTPLDGTLQKTQTRIRRRRAIDEPDVARGSSPWLL